MEPASGRADSSAPAQIPRARPTKADGCGLHKPPFLIVGALAAHFLAALSLVLNPSAGPSQQQAVSLSRLSSKKPKPTTSWSWQGCHTICWTVSWGQKPRCYLYLKQGYCALFNILITFLIKYLSNIYAVSGTTSKHRKYSTEQKVPTFEEFSLYRGRQTINV